MSMRALLALMLWILAAPAALAADAEVVRIELLPGTRLDDGRHIAGLRIVPAPGWKTYWRVPGEAGIPPRLELGGSQNVTAARLLWPAPVSFRQYGLLSLGYEGEVVLPIEIRTRDGGRDAMLHGEVSLGICRKVCVPVTARLRARLNAAAHAADPAIGAAMERLPASEEAAGVGQVRCKIAPGPEGLRLTAEITMPPVGRHEIMVVETGAAAAVVPAHRQGGLLRATAVVGQERGAVPAIDRSALRLTVLGAGRAVEIRGCRG